MAAPLPSALRFPIARRTPALRSGGHLHVVPEPRGSAATPASAAERRRAHLGIVAMVISTVLFPLSDMIAKALADGYDGLEVSWMRYAVLAILAAPVAFRCPTMVRTARPGLQVARGLTAVAATASALAGFAFLPLADATAIAFCAPMIVTGLAALILKEHVGAVRWGATATGFIGVLIIVRPGGAGFQPASILPLLSSLFSALTVILTRLGRDERIETTVMFTTLVGFAGLSIPAILVWRTPDAHAIGLGLTMGLLAAAASLLQLYAYRCASASLLAPFSYGQIVWAIAIAWLFTGAAPGVMMLAGSAVVIASGAAAGVRRPSGARRRSWTAIRRELEALQPAARSST